MEYLQKISSSNTRYSGCIHSQKRGTYKVCLHVMCLLHGSECVFSEVHVWQRVSVYSKLSQDNAVKKAQKRVRQIGRHKVLWCDSRRGDAKQRCRRKAQKYTMCQTQKLIAKRQKQIRLSTEKSQNCGDTTSTPWWHLSEHSIGSFSLHSSVVLSPRASSRCSVWMQVSWWHPITYCFPSASKWAVGQSRATSQITFTSLCSSPCWISCVHGVDSAVTPTPLSRWGGSRWLGVYFLISLPSIWHR